MPYHFAAAVAPRTERMVAQYVIDRSTSRFTVRAFAGGLLSIMGHNPTIAIREFSGHATFDPDAPEMASMKLQIRAISLEVTDRFSSKDRREIEATMHDSVLESAKYPTISFHCQDVSVSRTAGDGEYEVELNGELSLRGVARPLSVPARLHTNGSSLRATGEFFLRQAAYGIPAVTVAGGSLKVKDELKFAFEIVARKLE